MCWHPRYTSRLRIPLPLLDPGNVGFTETADPNLAKVASLHQKPGVVVIGWRQHQVTALCSKIARESDPAVVASLDMLFGDDDAITIKSLAQAQEHLCFVEGADKIDVVTRVANAIKLLIPVAKEAGAFRHKKTDRTRPESSSALRDVYTCIATLTQNNADNRFGTIVPLARDIRELVSPRSESEAHCGEFECAFEAAAQSTCKGNKLQGLQMQIPQAPALYSRSAFGPLFCPIALFLR